MNFVAPRRCRPYAERVHPQLARMGELLMNSKLLGFTMLLLVVLSTPFANAQFIFTPLDFPGSQSTIPQGINDHGVIIGTYTDNRVTRGFVHQNGVSTELVLPVPFFESATAYGINNFGEIVGFYQPFGIAFLLRRDGTVTNLFDLAPFGINPHGLNDAGWIVGSEYQRTETDPGFTLSPSGEYHTFTVGNSGALDQTVAKDINNRNEYIYYGDAADHAFLHRPIGPAGVTEEAIAVHMAIGGLATRAEGINDLGDVIGWVIGGSRPRAFLRFADRTTEYFEYPGAYQTIPTGVNNLRQIVGYYRMNPGDRPQGFLAVLAPEPSTLAMLLAALPLAYLAYRRR